MFKQTTLCQCMLLAFGTSYVAHAAAQDAGAQNLDRVEITGTSIKRIAKEGALPVQTFTKTDIERTGATSTAELLQNLTSMQGFSVGSDSVNGGGGGVTTASLRNLGSKYTLVLLNGHRIASYGSGSDVNLEILPLSMVEKVEVLLDGASATYGADAIAGVVNFITFSNKTTGSLDLSANHPLLGGGDATSFSISKGFGDLGTDGYNVSAGVSMDTQDKIKSSQRKSTRAGGNIYFSNDGKNYLFQSLSGNGSPPNLSVNGVLADGTSAGTTNYNPVLQTTGACGTSAFAIKSGTRCLYNYAATVDLQPAYDRKSLFASTHVALGKDFTGYAELLLSDVSLTAAYAPPAQPFTITSTSPLWNRYVVPTYAAAGGLGTPTRATVRMRLEDAGGRTDEYQTYTTHAVAGVDGTLLNWDVGTSFVHSANSASDFARGGYADYDVLTSLIASGAYDPFKTGQDSSKAALTPAVLSDSFGKTTTSLDILKLNASRPLFKLPGGDAYIGLGGEFTRQKYKLEPSMLSEGGVGSPLLPADYTDFIVGGGAGAVPLNVSRTVRSVFSEVLLPVVSSLELNGALRYDSYSKIHNSISYDPVTGVPTGAADEGNSYSKATYKLSAKFQPVPEIAVRSSYGTGFRAPSLEDISQPVTNFGVTASRACPVGTSDPLYVGCKNFDYEYKANIGGNSNVGTGGLKPETTKQFNLGLILQPTPSLYAALDYWNIKIKDALAAVTEDAAFGNVDRYRSLFSVSAEPGTGDQVLTFLNTQVNSAQKAVSGIDWDLSWKNASSFGVFTASYSGTYLLKDNYDYGFGDGVQTSLGAYGQDESVAVRVQSRLSLALEKGPFYNMFTVRHRSGYKDSTTATTTNFISNVNADGSTGDAVTSWSGLKIPAQFLVDWQGRIAFADNFSVSIGVRNLFDQAPHLSLKASGSNIGGVDPRYSDTVGRILYIKAKHTF